jgi:hypothetical protein
MLEFVRAYFSCRSCRIRPTWCHTSMPPLPEGDFRFLTAPWRGDIGVDQEMTWAVSRSQGSNRPSQMGREGSRVAVTAGRVATGPLWGRKYDCTEVLLTSFVVRRILGEGLRLRTLFRGAQSPCHLQLLHGCLFHSRPFPTCQMV